MQNGKNIFNTVLVFKTFAPIFAPPKGDEHYVREVVQPGRIPGLGPGGRRFESCPPDEMDVKIHRKPANSQCLQAFLFSCLSKNIK